MAEVNRKDEIQGEILHVYDGIEEADNQLPVWWLITFYGAILFAIGYWFYYHEYNVGKGQLEKYQTLAAEARAARGVVADEDLNALSDDPTAVQAGATIFAQQCFACHDAKGQGRPGLGPNLTDQYWIHGGAPTDIYKTVTEGVPEKGMVPWGPTLGDDGVKRVVAFILSIRNTNVPGREPQGEAWEN